MLTTRKALALFDDYYAMMSDKVRIHAYKKAIESMVQEGDVVVDLGAGPGLLSFWALKAGARRVYAIEKSDSIHLAEEVARVNGFSDQVVFIKDNSLNVELPEKADILISETLGTFGVEENTLAFFIDARNRFLKEGGRVLPEKLELFLAPAHDEKCVEKISFWKDVEGVDYSPALEEMMRRLMVSDISPNMLLAQDQCFASLNLHSCSDVDLREQLRFKIEKTGLLSGVAGWFKVQVGGGLSLSTHPEAPKTHWHQAFFPLSQAIKAEAGDYFEWSMEINAGDSEDSTGIHYEYFLDQKHTSVFRPQRVDRNSPCPCGSGKKYKKCCLR